MGTSTRRNLLVGLSVIGGESVLSKLEENQSRQPLARSSKEEWESEAGQPRSN
jgi:hypothetical protein